MECKLRRIYASSINHNFPKMGLKLLKGGLEHGFYAR